MSKLNLNPELKSSLIRQRLDATRDCYNLLITHIAHRDKNSEAYLALNNLRIDIERNLLKKLNLASRQQRRYTRVYGKVGTMTIDDCTYKPENAPVPRLETLLCPGCGTTVISGLPHPRSQPAVSIEELERLSQNDEYE